jgi:exopolysaccharide biosynthesis operon protein EpsL
MGHILTTRTKNNARTHHAVIIGGVCLFMSQKVLATALFNHIIEPYVSTALTYDSNVLRLPNNFTPDLNNNKSSKSSFIKQVKAGAAAKWQISQQQLIADVSVNQNWYSTYNELNYTGYNILGQWDWQLGKKLKGEITYNHSKMLNSFEQINRLISNLEKAENYIANGSYEFLPDWYLRSGFTRTRTYYPAVERQQSNLREVSKEFGLRYLNSLENMMEFRMTMTDGRYTNRNEFDSLDNTYTRVNYDLGGMWNYSVKTRIRAEIGYVSQKFTHVTSRNFSAPVARSDILWQATAKSSLFLEVWREVHTIDTLNASFALAQGAKLTPIWKWSETPRIDVELPISYEKQTSLGFNGDPTIVAQQGIQRIARLNLNYVPRPNIEMSAFAAYENRSTNDPTHTYQDQSVGFTMKVSF